MVDFGRYILHGGRLKPQVTSPLDSSTAISSCQCSIHFIFVWLAPFESSIQLFDCHHLCCALWHLDLLVQRNFLVSSVMYNEY
jgi:hypothetical protein